MGRGPTPGRAQPSGGPAWQRGAGIPAGRPPHLALGAGPTLYLASIVQGGGTLGGGGLEVEGRELILSPNSFLSPAIPNPN
jgi:hypothetical protein